MEKSAITIVKPTKNQIRDYFDTDPVELKPAAKPEPAKTQEAKPAQTSQPSIDLDAAPTSSLESLAKDLLSAQEKLETIKEQEKDLSSKKKELTAQANKLEAKIIKHMQNLRKDKLSAGNYKLETKAYKPSVIIKDKSLVPKEFIKETVKKTVDKNKLYKALKSGRKMQGITLQKTIKARVTRN